MGGMQGGGVQCNQTNPPPPPPTKLWITRNGSAVNPSGTRRRERKHHDGNMVLMRFEEG